MDTATHTTADSDSQLRQFKEEVKRWMKANRIKASDIASWTNKSVGTVKNWLYTPLNITSENQKLIRTFMENYDRGYISINGAVINSEDPLKSIGFITVNLNELNLPLDASEYWCIAADVQPDLLNNTADAFFFSESHIIFAEWFTQMAMQYTSKIIAPKYQEAAKRGERFDVYQYISATPSSIEPASLTCIKKIDSPFIKCLPVIKSLWKSNFLLAAAGIKKQTPEQFILSALQESAAETNDTNLREFLESYSDTSLD